MAAGALFFTLQQFCCQQAQEIFLRAEPIQRSQGCVVMAFCQCARPLQAVQGDKGRFVVIGITADRLAEFLGGRGHIEDVVHDLEHKADFGSILHQRSAQGRCGVCGRAAKLHSRDDKRTGLVAVQL